MARKHARPAAKKRLARLKAKLDQRTKFTKASAYLLSGEPRHGDARRLERLAIYCALGAIPISTDRY